MNGMCKLMYIQRRNGRVLFFVIVSVAQVPTYRPYRFAIVGQVRAIAIHKSCVFLCWFQTFAEVGHR